MKKLSLLLFALVTGCLALASPARSATTPVAWGFNDSGQVGDGTNATRLAGVPVLTAGALAGKTVTAVSAGVDHSLALTSDGRVYGWGYNGGGQVGDGTTVSRSQPVLVQGALANDHIISVSAGVRHSLALGAGGTVYSWGLNSSSQLGDQTTTNRLKPVLVYRWNTMWNRGIRAISAGGFHSLALAADGTVFAWGNNEFGQLGDGTTTNRSEPIEVTASGPLAGLRILSVSAGRLHNLALAENGKIYAWGQNHRGQLGNGQTTEAAVPLPVAVTDSGALAGKSITAVSAGSLHSLALATNGRVYAWGDNDAGRMGVPGLTNSSVPVPVDTSGVLKNVIITSIQAGMGISVATGRDGGAYGWGVVKFMGDRYREGGPKPVALPASTQPAGAKFVSLSSIDSHMLALVSDTTGAKDRTPPAVELWRPGHLDARPSIDFVTGAASDDVGVAKVVLYLRRLSDRKYWNGIGWGSVTPLDTQLVGETARPTFTRSTGLPSGSNLPDGAYTMIAYAIDFSGNRTSVTNNFTIRETTRPTITLTTPADKAVVRSLPVFSGLATDEAGGSGLAGVYFYLRRATDNKYWTGTTWGNTTALPAVLTGSPTRAIWKRDTGLPTGANLADGMYILRAQANDKAGNWDYVSTTVILDSTSPGVAISSPVHGTVVSRLSEVTGTAGDDRMRGLRRVAFYFRRLSDARYWNGSDWVPGVFELPTKMTYTTARDVTWRCTALPANLPDGVYRAQAIAVDQAFNTSAQVISQFTLKRTGLVEPASPVQLSSARASADGTIVLTFTGPLGASATDAGNYSVTANGEAFAVQSAAVAGNSVTLRTADLAAGSRATVSYGITDAQQRRVSGATALIVR